VARAVEQVKNKTGGRFGAHGWKFGKFVNEALNGPGNYAQRPGIRKPPVSAPIRLLETS